MTLRRITLALLLAVFAVGLLAPVAALATGPSAGDQQYVDPLGGGKSNGGGSGSSSGSSGSSGSSSSGTSSSGPSSSGTVSSSSTGSTGTASSSSAATTATTASATAAAGALPRTGFDANIAVIVGVGLIGAGFVLRRRLQTD